MNYSLKKANSITEYGILLGIVILFLLGINLTLRRQIESRVKRESDSTIGHAIGLEWPEQKYTIGGSQTTFDRNDAMGGLVNRGAGRSDWSASYSQPVPEQIMKHKQAAMHCQDVAKDPPSIDYKNLQYNDWDDI